MPEEWLYEKNLINQIFRTKSISEEEDVEWPLTLQLVFHSGTFIRI